MIYVDDNFIAMFVASFQPVIIFLTYDSLISSASPLIDILKSNDCSKISSRFFYSDLYNLHEDQIMIGWTLQGVGGG